MSKYLKLFLTTSQYNAYAADTANFIRPNVSLITETNTVEYNPIIPPYSGFCKLYLNDGSEVEIQGSGTLLLNQLQQYCETCIGAEIGTQCTAIGDQAFTEFYNIESVTIPNSVTSIGDSAFEDCYMVLSNFINNSSLDEVTNNYWNCTILDSEINGLCIKDNSVLWYRGNASSLIIPNSVTSIGDDAFYDCTSLTSVTIPNSVTSIGKSAFYDCTSLTSCTIGNGVTSIGNNAFEYCSSLTSISVNASTPPTLGKKTFSNTNDCPIYVPSASVSAYQSAWSSYTSRIQAISL